MVIIQDCVVCGVKVDVENTFGSIPEIETFCEEHMKYSKIFTTIRRLEHDVNELKNHIKEIEDYAKNVICEADRKKRNKEYY